MTKDLFARIYQQRATIPFDYYVAEFLERLPFKLLDPAEKVNRALLEIKGYEELKETLEQRHPRRWRNPELFPHLNRLNAGNNERLAEAVALLRAHIGLDAIEEVMPLLLAYTRLRDPHSIVLKKRDDQLKLCEGTCDVLKDIDSSPTIYRPLKGLFTDIAGDLYFVQGFTDLHECQTLMREAFSILGQYSEDLPGAICRQVAAVAFMSPSKGRAKSFSLKNFFIGGIFVSKSDPVALAEQLLHEYYHQCVWSWWLIEEPLDLPRSALLVSPISQQKRGVPTMVQAALIYRSLDDYYQFVIESEITRSYGSDCTKSAQARYRAIGDGLPRLFDALRSALSKAPISMALVEAIASC